MLAVDLIYQCIPNPLVSRIIGLECFFFFWSVLCPFFPSWIIILFLLSLFLQGEGFDLAKWLWEGGVGDTCV